MLNDIIEQDTSLLDCKHKHMMNCEAPPDKFEVLYRMFNYRIPWFHKQNLILRVITVWFLVLFHFFRDCMGPFNHLVL